MFHVDVTCEDHRLVCTSTTDEIFSCSLIDGLTGKRHWFNAEYEQIAGLVFLMLHPAVDTAPDTTVLNVGNMRQAATELLEGCPKECWPLP